MKDLIVTVADSYQQKLMEALLPRVPVSSHTRNFSFDIILNPNHDSGSYNESHELLRPFINQYRFAIVLFDQEGCGMEHLKSGKEIEVDVYNQMNNNGWEQRNSVIVIEPELENWMWQDNVHVEQAIGWEKVNSLYDWARNEGLIRMDAIKPERPKETLEKALRISNKPKSASTYRKIAENVSYRKCTDPAFLKLIHQLQLWFPVGS